MLNVLIFYDKYLIKGNKLNLLTSLLLFKTMWGKKNMTEQTQVMPIYWTVKIVEQKLFAIIFYDHNYLLIVDLQKLVDFY